MNYYNYIFFLVFVVHQFNDFDQDMVDMFKDTWPNLLDGSVNGNLCFWLHEWLDHGHHTGMEFKEYFKTVVGSWPLYDGTTHFYFLLLLIYLFLKLSNCY